MIQYTLDNKELSPLKKLQNLRLEYYLQLLNEMDTLRRRRIDLIRTYKNTVYDLDREIARRMRATK